MDNTCFHIFVTENNVEIIIIVPMTLNASDFHFMEWALSKKEDSYIKNVYMFFYIYPNLSYILYWNIVDL